MENDMNKQEEIKEIDIHGKKYLVADIPVNIANQFNVTNRLKNEAEEANYQNVKLASAHSYQDQVLGKMVEEAKLKPIEDPEEDTKK